MEIVDGHLAGVKLIKPRVRGDERGFFLESFRADALAAAGVDAAFVQDNHSRSRHGIVRGMHFQPGQLKLVRCVRGAVFDVVADIRPQSPTFGHWEGHELNDETHHELLVPDGFAHGFCVLSELADVAYKVSSYYDAGLEGGFRYDDPAVGIEWPLAADQLVASARDRAAPALAAIRASLSFGDLP
ncbi:MAG: dTDP-4-dehydrorhamnose 3,5-epimerase [Acidobacteriota bacterium]|nr:dTDP-4-dehydrorhamnose 3,5-epimerase [Acidobacteriota bacterium]